MEQIRAGYAVRIYSGVLGQEVWWVRDNGLAQKLETKPWYDGAPVFTLGELLVLTRTCATTEEVREACAIKADFGATIEDASA